MSAFAVGEVVIFGIQAAVRLHGAAQQAYIERTQEREIALPLPGLPHNATPSVARLYFSSNADGRRQLLDSKRLQELHAAAMAGITRMTGGARSEYVELFSYYRSQASGSRTTEGYLASDVIALNSIAQWRRGDAPHPTAARRIAGTLTEIGIDYFVNGPGTIKGSSPSRELVRDLLNALDDQNFAERGLEGVVERLFVGGLESLAEHPELVSGDESRKVLLVSVAKGLASDVNGRLSALPDEQRLFAADRLGDTAKLLVTSIVRHGGATLLQEPQTFLGSEPGAQSALVTRVGTTLLDIVVPAAGETGLDKLMSAESLDSLVKATLDLVFEHPDLLGLDASGKPGLTKIVQAVAAGLAGATESVGPDMVPLLAQLVLDGTATNLELLWDADGGTHLLVTATRTLLEQLAAPPADSTTWRLGLSRNQVLGVVDAVLDEVAENPALLSNALGDKPVLAAAAQSAVAELARVDARELTGEIAADIVAMSIEAAGRRVEFTLPIDIGGETATVLGHTLRAVFSAALSDDAAHVKARWVLARQSALSALTAAGLSALEKAGPSATSLAVLQEALDEAVGVLDRSEAFDLEAFVTTLDTRLGA